MELVFLQEKPEIHVVDAHTNFHTAELFEDKGVEGLWRAFVKCWPTIYLGSPNILHIDEAAYFNSSSFKYLANTHVV